ncbi:nucleotide disphospho-sugar-binding domain-containing protein [Paenibacillus sp. CF384]|uniref:nucleotide disphospho-sugar-binding domain-containing protein n=1 Tax=Paenibacillus sp. CF384 TaxID=1884382 RepID=UPI0008991D1C|nr:nucleotide disphospho-sugar-binding domain-containing protein [Paenibacillus sp. CF384]SDX89642.1 glycosyltransferase, MGT family [Paenibacillus sp. CF384]
MAKFLFAVVPIHGHISPGLPIARQLVELGHEVMWYSTSKYQQKIEMTGARFTKVQAAKDYDDSRLEEWFPGRADYAGINQLKFDLKHIFTDEMIGYNEDLTGILRDFPADVVITDSAFTGMLPMQLAGKAPKTAVYGILPLTLSSRDVAPYGLGISPNATAMGRIRNHLLRGLVEKIVFGDVQKHINKLMFSLGLPKLPHFLMNAPAMMSDLFLQGTTASFEYPRSDLPANVKFVGPFLPARPNEFTPPSWWEELKDRTVVHVTQGTIANENFHQLLIPTIQALAQEDVLVVATTGGKPTDKLNIPLPSNVRLESFIPHHELLPYVDAIVTNGGYGGVQMAINYGVPLVTAGKTEDKPEVCARVQWAGVGVNLKTGQPSKEQILHAVKDVLNKPHYKANVSRLSKEFQSADAIGETMNYLVQLADSDK